MAKFITNEEIEENIKQLSEKYKRLSRIKLQELYDKGELKVILETLTKKFGSIKNILNKYGIEYYREHTEFFVEKEDIEDNIKKLAIKYKRLCINDLKRLHKSGELIYQEATIRKKFSSLQELLNKYGIELYKGKHYSNLRYDKQKVIDVLSKLPKDRIYNSQVFKKLYNDKVIPFPYHFLGRHLGKIQDACNICGLTYKKYEHGKEYIKGKTYQQLYSKEKILEITKKWSKRQNCDYGCGYNEKKILDFLQKYSNINIQRSFWVYTNDEILYRVDGYIKELNLCIEVDEKCHFNNTSQKKDLKRENEIKEFINCDFLRINEPEWMKNKYYRYYIVDIINKLNNKSLEVY